MRLQWRLSLANKNLQPGPLAKVSGITKLSKNIGRKIKLDQAHQEKSRTNPCNMQLQTTLMLPRSVAEVWLSRTPGVEPGVNTQPRRQQQFTRWMIEKVVWHQLKVCSKVYKPATPVRNTAEENCWNVAKPAGFNIEKKKKRMCS